LAAGWPSAWGWNVAKAAAEQIIVTFARLHAVDDLFRDYGRARDK
jgi:hypothetical protein